MNLKTILPILDWLPNYNKSWLKGDINAGLTVGVVLIPQGIAYAMIAGLPPIYGLYTALIPQVIYALFGTSRQLSIGPAAMDSLIVAAGVSVLAEIGTQHFIEFAILLSFLMGAMQLIFGVFKLGFLVNFLSKPVISGFTSAAALIIGFNQFNHLFGIGVERNNKIHLLLHDTFNNISAINVVTTVIGLVAVIMLVFLSKKYKKIPAALVVVVIGLLVVRVLNLDQFGVKIVGEIPKGLPGFTIPSFSKDVIIDLLPAALTLAFIVFLEAISIAKAMEAKHTDHKVIPNQELIALGMSNIVGSFFQAYPASGGFSRTAVNNQANAKTQMASLIAAIVVGFTLLFLTPVFYYLPKAVLGAIIIVSVFGLLDLKTPKLLWRYAKVDLAILVMTFLATSMIGITEGILFGIVISIALLIYKSTKPHIAILGRIPGTNYYRNKDRFENVSIHDNILIVRFDAQLHFANLSYFRDKLQEFSKDKGDKLKFLIIDGSSLNNLDSSAIFALNEICAYFKNKQIKLAFTGIKGPVRDKMAKSGLVKEIGEEFFFMSIHGAVDYYETNFKKDLNFNEYIYQVNN